VSAPPELSVVVVTWRDRENVLRCLASLREHVTVPYEVIVVDDAGGDGTPEAVREQFPEAVVLAKLRNEGLVAGRNAGVPLARGRAILMLDSDTEVRAGSVETLLAALDRNPAVGLVGPKLVGADGELQPSCRRFPPFLAPVVRRGPFGRINDNPPSHRRHLMQDFDHAAERPVVWVSGAAQMWRAELAPVIGPYDRRVSSYGGEDLDWCLRVWRAGAKVHYVPDAVIVHHWQAVTRQNLYGRKAWRAFRDWYYLQFKHRSLRRAPALADALR
jgi:hypothetical protein